MTTSARFFVAAAAALLVCSTGGAALAQVPTAAQAKCIGSMNDAASKAALAQLVAARKCLISAAKGKLPPGQTAQQCLTADDGGKIAKVVAAAAAKETGVCIAPLPSLGYTPSATSTGAALSGALDTYEDLFGADLDAGVILASTSADGAKCQSAIAKAANKITKAVQAEFRACKKAALKAGTVDDATDLEACYDAIDNDAKGKVAKSLALLTGALTTHCATTTQAAALPGACSAAVDASGCVESALRCRTCQTFNVADAIDRNCDLFDDSLSNASCADPSCVDADNDSYGTGCIAGDDCDDMDDGVNPGADELCNGDDDDCNGTTDDFPVDVGTSCGASSTPPCSLGTNQCVSGALECVGDRAPGTETCNGIDDDCDGSIDLAAGSPPADATGSCDAGLSAPPGATSACIEGTKACTGGIVTCDGSTGPSGTVDQCLIDANCDGSLTNQPDTNTDTANCGSCGNNCFTGSVHANWSCAGGACQFTGCEAGYIDLDGNQTCEYACTFSSSQEACDGVDNDCDGQTDEGVVAPDPDLVCNVSPAATATECTSGVVVSCIAGSWSCDFPDGVCTGGCSGDDEICDALDNDCDGALNENIAGYGRPCFSDDGIPAPGHGVCRTSGTMVCNGDNAITCSAQKANCADLPGGCTETCDAVDNDCDGLVDESNVAKGSNSANFVSPQVTKLGAALWIYSYEASRPTATATTQGYGNGYVSSAPVATTIDKVPPCSVSNRLPWSNVTGSEAEQACAAVGGTLCTTAQWQLAAQATASCLWGYNPRGSACTSVATGTKFCNLAANYDYSGSPGQQQGLLPTASGLLQNCWADWSSLQGNTGLATRVNDITGNLREITKAGTNQYSFAGGSFRSWAENGGRSSSIFLNTGTTFRSQEAGFRCCFTSNPTL